MSSLVITRQDGVFTVRWNNGSNAARGKTLEGALLAAGKSVGIPDDVQVGSNHEMGEYLESILGPEGPEGDGRVNTLNL